MQQSPVWSPPASLAGQTIKVAERGSGRAKLTLARRFSSALALVVSVGALVGVLVPSVFKDPPMYAGNARGTAVVILLVAMPSLIASMILGSEGSMRARIVWLGTLSYLLYNAILFAFTIQFNALFPFYVASLALALWSFATLFAAIDRDALRSHVADRMPVRAIGGYLVVVGMLFAGVWIRDVGPALLTNTRPAGLSGTQLPTNAIEVLDFAFTLPLAVMAGVSLWRRRAWAYLAAGALLVMLTIEGVSVATDQLFGHLADPSQPLTAVPMFIVLTVVGLIPTISLLRHVGGPHVIRGGSLGRTHGARDRRKRGGLGRSVDGERR